MKLILLTLLTALSLTGFSQDTISSKKKGMEFSIGAGGAIQQLPGLNNRLTALGFGKAKTFLPATSFIFGLRFSQVIAGFDIGISQGGDNNSTQNINFGLFLSTNAIRTGKIIIAPHLGAGMMRMVHKQAVNATTDNFDAILLTARNQVELEHKSIYGDAGITLKYAATSYVIPFFRLGYRYGFSEKEWKVMNASSTGGPMDRAGVFYFQLILGSGK